ncbi:hypothetical protein [Polymorphospora rubra]|uniref:Uncharacterized protein n=1 Tax=Polymorphospora rubra TaxID=338584 RepID=A0A810MZ16_9ACTN|nr:hypothetical protein [Polymorphospora rubra]BCJ65704.1 hypothetical protein Prubr_27250 [Polymorphospora rubra]
MTARVQWMWTTPILLEDLSDQLSPDDLASLRDAADDELVDVAAAFNLLDGLAAAFGNTTTRWSCHVQELASGDYRSPGYDAAYVYAYLVLNRIEGTPHENSGNIVFADPRAGIQNVFVPGMPWNKAISMRAEPGRLVGAPGWVSSMITPLATGETLALLQIRGWRA